MGFPDAIRVSVGTQAENEKLLHALGESHILAGRNSETHSGAKKG
jgi:hypothetical protein